MRRYAVIVIVAGVAALALLLTGAGPGSKPRQTPSSGRSMTDEGLNAILRRLDPDIIIRGNIRELTVEEVRLVVVSDAAADRMRIMTPVAPVDGLDAGRMKRLLQASFDAVLDARYAIAQGRVWSAYIHPLSPLTDAQVLSGVAQVVVAAKTYGTTYTSGALVFGGGDSNELNRELYDRIVGKGKIKI